MSVDVNTIDADGLRYCFKINGEASAKSGNNLGTIELKILRNIAEMQAKTSSAAVYKGCASVPSTILG